MIQYHNYTQILIVFPVDISGEFSYYIIDVVKELTTTLLVIEAKLKGSQNQYKILDEMILTGQFIRNICLRYWMDNQNVKRNNLQKLCSVLA